jgi:hypothetical protein
MTVNEETKIAQMVDGYEIKIRHLEGENKSLEKQMTLISTELKRQISQCPNKLACPLMGEETFG